MCGKAESCNKSEKSLANYKNSLILSSLYYLPMQMKYTLQGTQWDYEPHMTVEEFIDENDWPISEQYIEEYPHKAHKINDGDIDDVCERAYWNKPFYRELMHELYELYLLAN